MLRQLERRGLILRRNNVSSDANKGLGPMGRTTHIQLTELGRVIAEGLHVGEAKQPGEGK